MPKGRPNRTGVDWSDPKAVAAYKRESERHHEYNQEYSRTHYQPVPQPHTRKAHTKNRPPLLFDAFTERFWSRVERQDVAGCWPWTGATFTRGYGKIERDGRQYYAHRVAYELTRGEIPNGARLERLCTDILCCNPSHYKIRETTE